MRKGLTVVLAVVLLSIPLPSLAEEVPPCAEGLIHYLPYCFTPDQLTVYLASRVQTEAPRAVSVAGVEQWRWHVAQFFPAWAVESALKVMRCESGGDPEAANSRSDARGLFQQRLRYWDSRAAAAGFSGASVFDPWANIGVSHWLWAQTGTWRHWSCRP